MPDSGEHTYETPDPGAALGFVDALIGRALQDLEKLVQLRAELTGEDPFGDRHRRRVQREEALADLERRRAEARQRDPEGWAAANAWAREMLQRDRRHTDESPPSGVQIATDLVARLRQARQAETEARWARLRRMHSEAGREGDPLEGFDA